MMVKSSYIKYLSILYLSTSFSVNAAAPQNSASSIEGRFEYTFNVDTIADFNRGEFHDAKASTIDATITGKLTYIPETASKIFYNDEKFYTIEVLEVYSLSLLDGMFTRKTPLRRKGTKLGAPTTPAFRSQIFFKNLREYNLFAEAILLPNHRGLGIKHNLIEIPKGSEIGVAPPGNVGAIQPNELVKARCGIRSRGCATMTFYETSLNGKSQDFKVVPKTEIPKSLDQKSLPQDKDAGKQEDQKSSPQDKLGSALDKRKDLDLLEKLKKDHDIAKLSEGAHKRIEELRVLGDMGNSAQKAILAEVDKNFVGNEAQDRELLERLKRDKENVKLSPKEAMYLKHIDRVATSSKHPNLTATQLKLIPYIPLHLLKDTSVMTW